jgi:large subunit ribosomal protein L25
MAEITLAAETGRFIGSASSRRLRRDGRIPAVVYGHGLEPTSVSVDGRDFRHALSGAAGLNQLLSLDVEGEVHLALARELQRHPVRHTVVHVDFQVVRRDELISAEVPVALIGEAKLVEQEGGLLEQPLTTITVHSTPTSIPNVIEIDVSGLAVGDAIRVGDIALPPGVTTDLDPEEVVVAASASSAMVAAGPADGAAEDAAASDDDQEG